MSTENEEIDLELKRVQLARERLVLDDELRTRDRKLRAGEAVKKVGDAAQVSAFAAGYVGARAVRASGRILERMIFWGRVLLGIWVVAFFAWLAVNWLGGS